MADAFPANVPGEASIYQVAAESTASVKGGEQAAAVSLEQAIVIAREAFSVPESLDQFSTSFDQSGDNSFWELHWYRSKEPGGDMNVRVNATTGEVWSMYRWTPPAPGQNFQGLPAYTREQAEGIASNLAKKLQPERFRATSLQPVFNDYVPLTFKERGQVEYSYNYARMINGVVYQENSINVGVSGDTGEVIRFEVNWDEDTSSFPSTAGCITQAQAEQVFHTDGTELIYFRPRVPGGTDVPVKLVYQLNGSQQQVIIDAITGEIRKEDGFNIAYDMAGSAMMKSERMNAQALTPAEEVAVEEVKDLLPREKALEAATAAVKVPREYTLDSSRLEQEYLFKDKKSWHFFWHAGEDANRKGIDVSIDAVSGELVVFSRYDNKYDYSKAPDVKLSEEAARKVAEDFIKKSRPDKWEQIVFASSMPELGPVLSSEAKPLPRSYTFNWVRQVNSVKFPDNGFYLSIDSTTGEITSYRMNWWDVDFPDPQGVIGQEAAARKYLLDSPLTLAYKRLWSTYDRQGSGEPEVSLVYNLVSRNFAMLDAFTGEPLNSNGNIVTLPAEGINFQDLEGSPAREAVETLAHFGIIDATGSNFRPDDFITQAELIVMLVKGGQQPGALPAPGDAAGGEPWYQRYYDEAARMGIIEAGENPDPDMPVTREVLARLTVNATGCNKVARLSDIFALDFQDAGEVSAYFRGHVAISAALGLMEPVDGKFEPQRSVTRAEAAMTVLKLLKAGNN
ncbi:MAG: Endo-1,4-beta-xylanase A precursor [Pelotomaculum sp. PtaU1.Bin065]|nr:MAG: Endo-1,4-beta-xylanase A precursor [Pelotomaculum sp. PtaU1.Bin065]